jgi:hypothetical protein
MNQDSQLEQRARTTDAALERLHANRRLAGDDPAKVDWLVSLIYRATTEWDQLSPTRQEKVRTALQETVDGLEPLPLSGFSSRQEVKAKLAAIEKATLLLNSVFVSDTDDERANARKTRVTV